MVDGGEHALDAFVVSCDGCLEGAVRVQLVLHNLVQVVQLGSQGLQQGLGGAMREDLVYNIERIRGANFKIFLLVG